jgi:drug/metabolite transporter, DME family
MKTPPRPGLARIQILAAALLFSTGGMAIKSTELTSWQVASLRSGIAALAVLLLLREARRGWTPRTLLVAAGYAGTLIAFVLANKLTTAAATIYLQSTAPIYILLLSPLLLNEPIRRQDLLFALALAAGLGLFFVGLDAPQRTAPFPLRGNLLAVLSGVFWALTLVGLRWLERGGERGGGAAAVAAGNTLAFLFCLPWALPLGSPAAADWLIVGYLGVFQIGLAYVFLTSALGAVPAFEASLLLLVEPVLNPLWAWLVHGEAPGPWSVAGAGTILAAMAVKSGFELRRSTAAKRARLLAARLPRPEGQASPEADAAPAPTARRPNAEG